MARTKPDGLTGVGHEHTISAFGGHPLEAYVPKFAAMAAAGPNDGGGVSGLAALGITDAEQLIALAAVGEGKEQLQESLGVSKSDLDALLKDARKLLPPTVANRMESPLPAMYGLGALAPPTGEPLPAAAIDPSSEAAASGLAAAQTVNLSDKMSPIRNQGARGTCVSFALSAINEYAKRVAGTSVDLSEQHLYQEMKLIDGHNTNNAPDCGTWQKFGAQVLANRGQCREIVWAYNPQLPCNNNGTMPGNARTDAVHYKVSLALVVSTNIAAIKAALATHRPVALSFPVYDSWYKSAEVQRSGRITLPLAGEPQHGGHAICAVGYQDLATAPGGGYFIIRNSWGTGWAYESPYGQGYGVIPYSYIAQLCWEAFTLSASVALDGPPPQPPADDGKRTITITVRGNVNLIIE